MPIPTAVVRISRISFQTDMTRADAPVFPFARVLECVWPNAIRWVGLIGRTRLTPLELDKINLDTWPEFQNPHDLLMKVWDCGWDSTWGDAGWAIQKNGIGSAWRLISKICKASSQSRFQADPDATLTEASPILLVRMMAERTHLAPTLSAPILPLRVQPTASRTETDVVQLAA